MAEGPELVVKFASELADFEAGINRVIARINELDAIVKRVSVNFSKMGATGGATAGNINQLIAALNSNKRSLDANAEAAKKNTDALAKLNTTMANSKRPLDQSGRSIVGVTAHLKGMLAGYIGVHTAISASRAFVQNAVEVGRYQKVLETASGSQSAFAKNTKFLESVADEFRLNVLNLGREFANLNVATKGTVLEGKETERIFRATAMAASALQMSGSQVTLTFKAFTDMISKGIVSSEELKRQLGNHMPGAFVIAARAMGVTTRELQKMLDNGQLMTADLLPKLAAELEKSFGKGAQSGAQSLGNNIEYAKGQAKLLFAQFGQNAGLTGWVNNWAIAMGNVANNIRKAREEAEKKPKSNQGKWGEIADGLGLSWDGFNRAFNPFGGLGSNAVVLTQEGERKKKWEEDLKRLEERIKSRKPIVIPSTLTGTPDDGKKKKTEFEKLIATAEKLKGVIEDKALQDVKNGKAISIPEKTIEQWNKLYNIISKVAEATGANIPNSIKGLDEKLNKPLKNLIDDDGNISYGRPEKWEAPKSSPDLYGGQSWSDFLKLEIDVDKLWKKEDIYRVEERLSQLKEQLRTKLIDTFGDLSKASEMGWGAVLESNKKGAEGINEATFELGGINKLSRNIKQLESQLINSFGSLEEAAANGWAGVVEAIRSGSLSLDGAVEGVRSLDLSKRLNEIIKGFTADAAVSIGEALGTMMAGLDGADASKKIGQVFGDLISNLGKALIAFAAVKIAADASLKSMNPYVALAAGIAAVAAGTALKQTANKQQKEAAQRFWTGGIVDGPGGIDRVPAMLTKGEMVLNDRQQSNLFRMMNGGYGMATTGMTGGGDFKIEVLMSGVLSGNDISISNERAVRSRKVHRGSLG